MYCTKCGAEVLDVKFCTKCGEPVDSIIKPAESNGVKPVDNTYARPVESNIVKPVDNNVRPVESNVRPVDNNVRPVESNVVNYQRPADVQTGIKQKKNKIRQNNHKSKKMAIIIGSVVGFLLLLSILIIIFLQKGIPFPLNDKLYLAMANSQEKKGDIDKAVEILEKAYKVTEKEIFQERIGELNPEVEASEPSGTYDDSIEVKLSTLGDKIYYTLDGTEPDDDSLLYEDPIIVNEYETTIRAVAENKYGDLYEVYDFEYIISSKEPIEWSDYTIESLIRSQIGNMDSDLIKDDLNEITELDLAYQNVYSLEDLKYLPNIETLYLQGNELSDLSMLYELSNLKNLWINAGTGIDITKFNQKDININEIINWTDYSIGEKVRELLGNNTNDITVADTLAITELDLSNLGISDISDLRFLKNLEVLHLYGNYLYDISALSELTNLKKIYVDSEIVNDVKAQTGSTDLIVINADEPITWVNPAIENEIRDQLSMHYGEITVADMLSIRVLDLYLSYDKMQEWIDSGAWNGKLDDLAHMENLVYLNLGSSDSTDFGYEEANEFLNKIGGFGITDISPLRDLNKLEQLYLLGNKITDISALSEMKNLTSLNLAHNQITDLSALGNLTNLTCLDLSGNGISDINPLANLTALTELKLGSHTLHTSKGKETNYNKIKDLTVLSNLGNLVTLDLSGNGIDDISVISNLLQLKYLTLTKNNISNIDPLSGLIQLETLSLDKNKVTNIDSLANLGSLATVTLKGNKINDYTPVSHVPNVSQ